MIHTLIDMQSILDLKQDAFIFSAILNECLRKLRRVQQSTQNISLTSVNVENMVRQLLMRIKGWTSDMQSAKTHEHMYSLYEKKNEFVGAIHECIGIVGQTSVSSHWQSPAIDQSVVDAAGSIRGKIIAHFNDYTRDQHVLGVEFEKIYRREYVRVPRTIPVYTYATVSGMAAMTTAALMILGETSENAPILLGASCYFETKQLIKKMFGVRVHEEDLTDQDAVSRYIQEHSPVAVFADTIGNEPYMHVIDCSFLIHEMNLSKTSKRYVVLDTSASAYMRPLMHSFILPRGVMLIGVESQNKLLQYGFDRVTAGVVWGTGFEAMKLYDYRDHAGTICPDVSIAALPVPNSCLASKHIGRLERNTKLLVDILKQSERMASKNVRIVYPKEAGFNGVYCMLTWKERPLHTFDTYIKKVMKKAKQLHIPIVYGTSFGFHTTRIYTVAMHTQYEWPFLRISPGTETKEQMYKIGELFCSVL